ncbi:MAG: sodium:solute symporter family protein [Bacteroidota bacterium]
MHLAPIDYGIIAVYFLFVLGIGFVLKNFMKTSSDFLMAGRRIPAWVTGLAFMGANLGALEIIGMTASSAQYGAKTINFYWTGAIPAMLFVALFMMPFYYSSRIRSVPEYLRIRFNEPTRAFNSFSFALFMILTAGISMFLMGKIFNSMFGWNIWLSILLAALITLVYTFLGGLSSSIYNEVLQFFLIVIGLLPLAILPLLEAGGWGNLARKATEAATAAAPAGMQASFATFAHVNAGLSSPSLNPLGVEWIGMMIGLGVALSFGYWCTDFTVIQRAFAAKDLTAAQQTPLIAAIPKMLFPILITVPGFAAIALPGLAPQLQGHYNDAFALMLQHYYPAGLMGLGVTALLASFMSGMAGQITAFNTIWTYDIYQTYFKKDAPDEHYLRVGKIATVFAVVGAVFAAFIASQFMNIMDYIQLLCTFFHVPLFCILLLGMFWKKTTPVAAFTSIVVGTLSAVGYYVLYRMGVVHYPTEMAYNFNAAVLEMIVTLLVAAVVTFFTKPRKEEELVGLVYSLTPKPDHSALPWYARPATLGWGILIAFVALNLIFW